MIPRYKTFYGFFFSIILFTSGIGASAIVKGAIDEHSKDVSHNEGAESVKHDKQKGEKVHQVETQLNDSHKNQFSKASDEAKYLKKDHDTKSVSDSDAYQGYNAKKDQAEDTEATGFKRGHKKGHHKQGFQNSYHKDESSNKSTYFDDFNDEGDQAAYNMRQNSYDNQGGRSYKGAHNNGQEYVKDNYQAGGYNRHGDYGNKHAGHQDYGKNYHLDDVAHYNKFRNGHDVRNRDKIQEHHQYLPPPPPPPPPTVHRDPGWDWQQWEDRRGWNRPELDPYAWNQRGWESDPGWGRDYGGPGYFDDHGLRHEGGYGHGPYHGYGYGYDESRADPVAEIPKNAPVVAHTKQTITIYEDPRYDGKDKGHLRREEGDYLQLEFKPSSHRYASYDDTYYNVPTSREGSMEASKINKLVYNYRRQ